MHLVTVNDYLAKRDSEWNAVVYERLGATVGHIENMMPFAERKVAYGCDITYGTNSEFGFDYLRDNMAVSLEGVVQRSHTFAIVDEVDSILIDEARTPLIISGEPETAAKVYYDFARVVRTMTAIPSKEIQKGFVPDADYAFDEKFKTVAPEQSAIEKIERALGLENLYDPRNVQLVNHLNQALKAQSLYQRDVDYVVQDGEVKIVDEFTGRIMEGRRWSEGLHQAVEAKEGVRIQEENVTLATITLQNYFRLYEKLAGMTGTAKTEEKEFVEIYDLHVVEIPTNVKVARNDENDFIFKTKEAKFNAVINDLVERHESGQPVLVGTIAVETSEYLSQLLERRGVTHAVLNAKQHEREAEIIMDAGQVGAVTIATNMAGRGVDIKIDDTVRELGGLYVLGTERHESRRIDNQLRGRSGRQGDPGESRFYLSGEDDLVRLFAGDRIKNIMNKFKLADDQPMEAKILSNQIEGAQKKVEEQNFVMRKNVLKYDDVMNTQRMVIYEQRRRVLEGDDLSEDAREWIKEVIERTVDQFLAAEYSEEWDIDALVLAMQNLYGSDITAEELRDEVGARPRQARRRVRRGRDGRVPAARGAIRRRRAGPADHARARAVRDPADRRRALARAPRGDGLHARGHPPALVRAEGPARRVPRRGSPDVRGARQGDPRGGRLHALPRRDRARRGSRARAGAARAEREPLVRARDGGRRGRHRGGGRELDRGRGRRRHGRLDVDVDSAAAGRVVGAREARPQRPLLVRVGEKVQEVPWRIAPPSRAHRSSSS